MAVWSLLPEAEGFLLAASSAVKGTSGRTAPQNSNHLEC